MNPVRRVLLILLAATLASVLGFLYYKTEGVDFARQVRVNEHLRNLKATDGKWNESLLRSRSDTLAKDDGPPVVRDQVAHDLDGLAAEARALDDAVLVANAAALATLYEQKLRMLNDYREHTRAFRGAVRTVLDALPPARTRLRDARETAAVPPALLVEARDTVDRLAATVIEFSSRSGAAAPGWLDAAAGVLDRAAAAMTLDGRDPVAAVATGLQRLSEADKPREASFQKLYFFPTAPRTDTLGALFAQSFQRQLEERDLYRVYLIAFSAALLIALGYIGLQLFRSYRVINDVNARLQSANDTLEQNVAARTRELSDALRHLKESEAMLVQTEKMSSLGQMVAGVAHEINTPLAYVKSSLETVTAQLPALASLFAETTTLLDLLQAGDTTESQIGTQFGRVNSVAEALREHEVLATLQSLVKDGLYGIGQISDLVGNLKNFSRLDRNRVAQFDLREGLESTLQIARNAIKHKDIRKRFEDIPLISCSPSQINQVFLNLITNAAQATPEAGGIVAVSVRRVGDTVVVEVQDNGHGIAPEVLPKIFDPFFTTKEVGHGTGLGLSIAYKIVQQHGGRITVASQVGRGTRFTVTLPIHPPAEAAVA